MKKLFMFIAAVLALVSCSSVTSNKEDIMVQEDRKVGKFTSIAIQGSPTVIYRQGNTCTVKVRANKSVIKDIKTTIDKGCLNVSMKGNGGFFVFSKEKPITIYVTSPDLIGVEIAGSGDFKSEMPLDTDNIRLVVRGSGDIDFDGKRHYYQVRELRKHQFQPYRIGRYQHLRLGQQHQQAEGWLWRL